MQALTEGGCEQVYVVLGAAAAEAEPLLDGLSTPTVLATDWAEGMGASLRAGQSAIGAGGSVLVSLVDLPDVGARPYLTSTTSPWSSAETVRPESTSATDEANVPPTCVVGLTGMDPHPARR